MTFLNIYRGGPVGHESCHPARLFGKKLPGGGKIEVLLQLNWLKNAGMPVVEANGLG
jgi:hypothetical protein